MQKHVFEEKIIQREGQTWSKLHAKGKSVKTESVRMFIVQRYTGSYVDMLVFFLKIKKIERQNHTVL